MRSSIGVLGYMNKQKSERATEVGRDFSGFDRIFYMRESRYEDAALLLFSRDRQEFWEIDLEGKEFKPAEIELEGVCQEAEVYDNKLFCVNSDTLTLEVFFPSKKKRLFNKRIFRIEKEGIKLREDYRFLIWKQEPESGAYWCLLGPMFDGRYVNFELREKWFVANSADWSIEQVIFVSLALEKDADQLPEVICAVNEESEEVLCYDKEENFFEYRDFCSLPSRKLKIMCQNVMVERKVRRMYFYYPYNYLRQEKKNQLRTSYRGEDESALRDRFKQVILCMEGAPLMKMRRSQDKKDTEWWTMEVCIPVLPEVPIDVTFNEKNGKMYILYARGIQCQEAAGIDSEFPKVRDDKMKNRGEKLMYERSTS